MKKPVKKRSWNKTNSIKKSCNVIDDKNSIKKYCVKVQDKIDKIEGRMQDKKIKSDQKSPVKSHIKNAVQSDTCPNVPEVLTAVEPDKLSIDIEGGVKMPQIRTFSDVFRKLSQHPRDIRRYLIDKNRISSKDNPLDISTVDKSHKCEKLVKPVSSGGRIKVHRNRNENASKSQNTINNFLKKKEKGKDIALSTPGKRKFEEIQSIFDSKKRKGG